LYEKVLATNFSGDTGGGGGVYEPTAFCLSFQSEKSTNRSSYGAVDPKTRTRPSWRRIKRWTEAITRGKIEWAPIKMVRVD
jgi:hypothetical protein